MRLQLLSEEACFLEPCAPLMENIKTETLCIYPGRRWPSLLLREGTLVRRTAVQPRVQVLLLCFGYFGPPQGPLWRCFQGRLRDLGTPPSLVPISARAHEPSTFRYAVVKHQRCSHASFPVRLCCAFRDCWAARVDPTGVLAGEPSMQPWKTKVLCAGRYRPRQFEYHPRYEDVVVFGTLRGEGEHAAKPSSCCSHLSRSGRSSPTTTNGSPDITDPHVCTASVITTTFFCWRMTCCHVK